MGSPGNRRENRHFHGNWSAPSLLYGIEKSSEEGTARKTSYSLSRWSSCRIKFLAGSPAIPSLRLSQISRCPEASTTRSSLSSTDFLKATLESLLCAVYKWKIEDSFFYSLCRFDDAKWTTDREKEFKCSLCCDVFQDCFSSFFLFFLFLWKFLSRLSRSLFVNEIFRAPIFPLFAIRIISGKLKRRRIAKRNNWNLDNRIFVNDIYILQIFNLFDS